MNKLMGPKGEGYVVIQFILFGLILLLPGNFGTRSGWPTPWNVVGVGLGSAMLLYSLVVVSLGLLNLGRNLTAVPHPKEDAVLVQSGAYRIVRHPIYSGLIVGASGWAFLNNAEVTLLLALLLFFFFDWKTRREEQMLAAKFPAYSDYQRRVSKLIPFLY